MGVDKVHIVKPFNQPVVCVSLRLFSMQASNCKLAKYTKYNTDMISKNVNGTTRTHEIVTQT